MTELRWILLGLGALLVAGIYLSGRRQAARSLIDDAESGSGRIEPSVQGGDSRDAKSLSSHEPEVSPAKPAVAEPARPTDPEAGPRLRGTRREPQLGATHSSFAQSATDQNTGWPPVEEPAGVQVRRHRLEPTVDDVVMGSPEISSRPTRPTAAPGQPKPQRSIERRKILALRLVAPTPQNYAGQQLLEQFARLGLKHGRYGIFHRPYDDERSVFSIASMVEPGSFDLDQMVTASYPGLTLFAVLPGPLDGATAFDSLVACARALHSALGGVLQDERGAALSPQRVAALQSEIAAFEQPPPGGPHA